MKEEAIKRLELPELLPYRKMLMEDIEWVEHQKWLLTEKPKTIAAYAAGIARRRSRRKRDERGNDTGRGAAGAVHQ